LLPVLWLALWFLPLFSVFGRQNFPLVFNWRRNYFLVSCKRSLRNFRHFFKHSTSHEQRTFTCSIWNYRNLYFSSYHSVYGWNRRSGLWTNSSHYSFGLLPTKPAWNDNFHFLCSDPRGLSHGVYFWCNRRLAGRLLLGNTTRPNIGNHLLFPKGPQPGMPKLHTY